MQSISCYYFTTIFLCILLTSSSCKRLSIKKQHKRLESLSRSEVIIPTGAFALGSADENPLGGKDTRLHTVSVHAFVMDAVEVTNSRYRQFVQWTLDSIIQESLLEDGFLDSSDVLSKKFSTRDPMVRDILYAEDLLLDIDERKTVWNTEAIQYKYQEVDYQKAAKFKNNEFACKDRRAFLLDHLVPIYPDTLVWVSDFTYSFNEPLVRNYFNHVSFNHYPVVGVSYEQAKAYCDWKTNQNPSFNRDVYRLPTEAEWEYAAKGGRDMAVYPWNGMDPAKAGEFLANFKAQRGNYVKAGDIYTTRVGSFSPNQFGLYDMSGNVSEWTSTTFHPTSYYITGDLNPELNIPELDSVYGKVVRGGGWKDVHYHIRTSSRDKANPESQTSYIGFRTVATYFGS